MGFLLFAPAEDGKIKTTLTKEPIRVEVFHPKLTKLYSQYEANRPFRISLFRIYSQILTNGKVKVYFALDPQNEIVHTAYIIPSNWKYAFLGENEANIGPCSTVESARGKGLYPYMINCIVRDNADKKCYLIIREENTPSIRGAQKAGFVLTGKKVRKTKLLHRFVNDNAEKNNGR